MGFNFPVSKEDFSEPKVLPKKTQTPEAGVSAWAGLLTFDQVENFLNSLWFIAVWSAAGRDLQHVVRTILREELQEEERRVTRGVPGWLRLEEGSQAYLSVKRQNLSSPSKEHI